MAERELRKIVIGNNVLSNLLLTLKIFFDVIPQVLFVYLIGTMMEGQTKKIKLLFVFMLASFILKALFSYFANKSSHENAYSKLTELRVKIIEHLKNLQLGFFKKHGTAELTNIIQEVPEQVEIYLAHGLPEIMAATIFPILLFVAMVFVDWRLALAMISGLPFMFLTSILSKKTINKNFAIYFEHESQMQEKIMEYVKNISVIKAFAKEETVSDETLKIAKEYVCWLKKSMKAVTIPMGLLDIFMEVGVAIVMILGSMFLAWGEISLFAFILSIIFSYVFVAQISKTATLHHFSIVFKEALKLIGKVLTAPLPENKVNEKLEVGDIEIKGVNFSYDGSFMCGAVSKTLTAIQERQSDSTDIDSNAIDNACFQLKDINLTFKQNTFNAIVGASGCGKSTLKALLMGFWDVDSGYIKINRKDIKNYSGESLSAIIGSVEQDVHLFDLSIFENIVIGKLDAALEEVIEAAKKARIHDFIMSLPDGYDTKVGEMGSRLSGGEKQRLSIARMILKNAPILILDEAMAAVDNENEKLINDAIEELSKDKTVITITHHLSTIKKADQIVVMDSGKVVATGTHEELMKTCEFYSLLVSAQNKVDNWDLK